MDEKLGDDRGIRIFFRQHNFLRVSLSSVRVFFKLPNRCRSYLLAPALHHNNKMMAMLSTRSEFRHRQISFTQHHALLIRCRANENRFFQSCHQRLFILFHFFEYQTRHFPHFIRPDPIPAAWQCSLYFVFLEKWNCFGTFFLFPPKKSRVLIPRFFNRILGGLNGEAYFRLDCQSSGQHLYDGCMRSGDGESAMSRARDSAGAVTCREISFAFHLAAAASFRPLPTGNWPSRFDRLSFSISAIEDRIYDKNGEKKQTNRVVAFVTFWRATVIY